ncbi:MAG: hypothetical protein PHF21_03880 [Bacilli bacterium]|nr:hypothetical protein [Bacilli bacterium]
MEYIKENKITLIICSSLLILGGLIAFLIKNDIIFTKNDDLIITNYLKDYEVNEIVPINISEEQMARKYLAEYVKMVVLDIDQAYQLLEKDYRDLRFKTLKDFKDHFTNLISDQFLSAKVTKLNITKKGNYKQFYIVDGSDNIFIFNEYSIMQYKVILDLVTI